MPRWQREILRSSDADVRRDVGRYILAARKPPASAVPGVGAVVEFARGGRLHCGLVWPHVARGRSLLIVGVTGEETWIRRDKVNHVSVQKISTDTRSVAIRALQQIDGLRRDLQDSIDMPTLWEIALEAAHSGEESIWTTGRLTDLYFGGGANGDQRAALLRALYAGDWFARRGTGWLALPKATVERRRYEHQRRDDEERNLEVAAAWLRTVADGQGGPRPLQAERAIALLEQVVLHGKESADAHEAARLMAKAHLHGPLSAWQILVALGHWDEDENLDLHRLGVALAFGEPALAQVDEMVCGGVSWSTTASCRRRLWGRPPIGFSGRTPGQVESAFGLNRRARGYRVRACLAAPALAVAEDGALDREAASRGIALALPDRDIPMLPPALQHLIALTADEFRPAVIVDIYLDGNLEVRRLKLRLRRVRPIVLPAADVGTPTGLQSRLHSMTDFARRLRQQRLAAGALFLPRQPRLEVRQGQLFAVGEPDTAELINEEFRVLTSAAVGEMCARDGIPAIFETRDAPLPPIDADSTEPAGRMVFDVAEAHALQRGLRRPRLQVEPAANTMLGVSACATVTEPMRRYADLVMQRQLVHLCTRRVARYSADDLERFLLDTTAARDAAARVEGSSRRYWSVKYLEQRVGVTLVGTVLERAGLGYVVLLDDCGLKTYVPVDRELTALPGDRLSLQVDQASARRDIIRLRVKS